MVDVDVKRGASDDDDNDDDGDDDNDDDGDDHDDEEDHLQNSGLSSLWFKRNFYSRKRISRQ